jgi:mRNA interferase MazF
MSYISFIAYSLSEVKGIREKKRAAVPKWDERLGFLATSAAESNRTGRRVVMHPPLAKNARSGAPQTFPSSAKVWGTRPVGRFNPNCLTYGAGAEALPLLSGHRPRNSAIAYLSTVTVAPVTSTIRGVPSEVVLHEEDGMKSPCAVNLHNAVTVSQQRLGRRVAQLSAARMNEACAALRFSLGCDAN